MNQKEVFEASRRRAEDRGVHARQRHLRHRDAEGHRRDSCRSSTCPTPSRRRSPTTDSARPVGRGLQGQGDRRRRAARGQPAQRCDPDHPRDGQAALVADGRAEHGSGLVRGPISQDARQACRRAAELRALVRPEQEDEQDARRPRSPSPPPASISTPTRSTLSRRCWSRPTPTSAPGRPIPRRWPTRSARPASRTTSSTGPGIQFDAKGQNDKLRNSAIQNRAGKLVTVAPKGATNAKAEWPMKPYDKR